MTEERLRFLRNLDALAPLSDHTPLIDVNEFGHVVIADKLVAPFDKFGIPRSEIMLSRLLGAMTTKSYVWTGRFDEHHMATPKADYTVIRPENDGDLGSAFRGIASLKIDLPRMMHNAAHAVFELHPHTNPDVMRTALFEVGQMQSLQGILNDHLYEDRDTTIINEVLCLNAIRRAIEKMEEPEVNMMPPLGELYAMDLSEIRIALSWSLKTRCLADRTIVHPAVRKLPTHRHALSRNVADAA